MEVTVVGCARCGETYDLKFTQFTRPVKTDKTYTCWAMCPEQNEPILLRVIEKGDMEYKVD